MRAFGMERRARWGVVISGGLLTALAPLAHGGDWPTFRGDAHRSGVSADEFVLPLGEAWRHRPSGAPRPAWPGPARQDISHGIAELSPTLTYDRAFHVAVADGQAYYGSSADDAVHCLDARTGEERWRFVTEGPVRLAPTVAEGRVFFGSDDGYVYCLEAADGTLVWKRRGGPEDLRLPGNGRLISQWPVRSGVVVEDGVVYFSAGVFPMQGVVLAAVRADDGGELWRRNVDLTAQGYLLASPSRLYVPAGRTAPHVFARADGEPLGTLGSAGGSFAIVLEDMLIQGPGETGQLEISEPATRERIVSSSALRLVANASTSFFLKRGSLSALDRAAWVEASRGIARLQRIPDEERTAEERTELADLVQARAACLKWNVACASPYEMILAGDLVVTGGDGEVTVFDARTGEERARLGVDGRAYGLAVADGRLYVSTDTGAIHCFGSAVPPGRLSVTAPTPRTDGTPPPGRVEQARRLVAASGATRGYALVLGAGDGALARALAAASELAVVGVEPDEVVVRRARAGGGRAVFHHSSLDVLPYESQFANLVVCDAGAAARGAPATPAREAWRLVRPSGGVLAVVGGSAPEIAGWASALPVAPVFHAEGDTALAVLRRGPLEGEGEWTHLYKNGRCFIPGDRIVYAADAYNGTILWTARLPDSRRLGAFLDSTNLVVGEEYLFWAAADRCHGYAVESGEERFAHEMPQLVPGAEHVWGYLALVGDTVFGSGCKPTAAHRGHTKTTEEMLWYQGMSLVTSDYLFALDRTSGGVRWTYEGGVVVDTTIAVADGRMHFVETTAPAALADEVGHMPLASLFGGGEQALVTLDAATGEVLHRRVIDAGALTEVCYLAVADGVVLLSGSHHAQGTVQYHYFAFDAVTGEERWRANHLTGLPEDGGHGEYNRHPTIVGGTVYAWPYAYALATGERIEGWRFDRHGHGCGGISASAKSLFWRGGNPWMIELAEGAEAKRLDSVSRPGCWINIIPAGGLVLIPEASAGCTCAFPLQTSMAFRPRRPVPRVEPEEPLFVHAFPLTLSDPRGGGSVRYTLDGSDPTTASPLYGAPITVGEGAERVVVRARTFWPDGRRSRLVERTFTRVEPRPAVEVGERAPGLRFQCFEGPSLARVGDLERCREVKTGVSERISLEPRSRDDFFGLRFTGYLEIPTDGVYTFSTRSDDGSRLSLDGEVVVDNDGLHGAAEKEGRVALAAGLHRLEVLFFEAAGSQVLEVTFAGPHLPKRALPPAALFH